MDELDVKVVLAMADCNLNIANVSRQLYMHRNTVINRINKIARVTKLDPMNFYELYELVQMVKERTENA